MYQFSTVTLSLKALAWRLSQNKTLQCLVHDYHCIKSVGEKAVWNVLVSSLNIVNKLTNTLASSQTSTCTPTCLGTHIHKRRHTHTQTHPPTCISTHIDTISYLSFFIYIFLYFYSKPFVGVAGGKGLKECTLNKPDDATPEEIAISFDSM